VKGATWHHYFYSSGFRPAAHRITPYKEKLGTHAYAPSQCRLFLWKKVTTPINLCLLPSWLKRSQEKETFLAKKSYRRAAGSQVSCSKLRQPALQMQASVCWSRNNGTRTAPNPQAPRSSNLKAICAWDNHVALHH